MKSLLNTPDIEPIKDADFLFGVWPWARGPAGPSSRYSTLLPTTGRICPISPM